jgi:hypothetical protein
MPNPKTIEELLKMDACPFKDGQEISYNKVKTLAYLMDVNLFEYCLDFFILYDEHEMLPFKMPDGYFYLPPDKQLGLPEGEWTRRDIYPLVKVLPFGVVKSYCFNYDFGIDHNANSLQPNDFDGRESKINILKQPPNLYNPLDQQVEDVSSQPAKETETMKLPWQDISTLFEAIESGMAKGSAVFYKENFTNFPNGYNLQTIRDIRDINPNFIIEHKPTHWAIVELPKAPTVEVPVDPERVSLQEFAENPIGKWFSWAKLGYQEFTNEKTLELTYKVALEIIAEGNPVFYATDPTAWLSHKAKQEGKN